MNTFTFTLQLDCPHCGNMIAVNAPVRARVCNSCQKEVTLSPKVWGGQLNAATRGSFIVGNPYKCNATGGSGRTPSCPECGKLFSHDPSWIGHNLQFQCPNCGLGMNTYPSPDWLKTTLPDLLQIISGDPPSEDGRAQPLQHNESASKPVMLSCPNCKASLKVTAASERTVPCEHCGVEVYLPDGLWMRLHPVQTVRPWTVIYNGSLETAEEIRERQRVLAQERADEDERIRRAAEDTEFGEILEKESNASLIWTGVIIVSIFLLFTVVFLLQECTP
jgi:DNA-directed RNA polymerase subunit M/transcription elongation factor TFIIS